MVFGKGGRSCSDLVRLTGRHPFNVEPPLPKLMEHGFITPAALHCACCFSHAPSCTWVARSPWAKWERKADQMLCIHQKGDDGPCGTRVRKGSVPFCSKHNRSPQAKAYQKANQRRRRA